MAEKKVCEPCEHRGYLTWAKNMLEVMMVFLVFYIFLRYISNVLDPTMISGWLSVATAILTYAAVRCSCSCK